MRVRPHIHRHPSERDREIRAVVEIEPAEKIPVRLPAAGVLRDDHAGDHFEQFAPTQDWARAQFIPARRPCEASSALPSRLARLPTMTVSSSCAVGGSCASERS